MITAISFDDLIRGKRILFINGIRSDIPSGGNTATQTLLRLLSNRCSVKICSFAPSMSRESVHIFSLKSFPAGMFILWYRYSHRIWLEFFSRLSPWLYLRLVWDCWQYRPHVLIFNHHSTFIFSYFFCSPKKILAWHDVPSVKKEKKNCVNGSMIAFASIWSNLF